MLSLKIDLSELEQFQKEIQALDLTEPIWEATRSNAMQLMREIKTEMPKDTGRAAASWGRFDARYLRGKSAQLRSSRRVRRFGVRGRTSGRDQIATSEDAIWREDKSNLSVDQGTFVPYVEALNEGHSAKAPAGFIDIALARAEYRLDEFEEKILQAIIWVTGAPVSVIRPIVAELGERLHPSV